MADALTMSITALLIDEDEWRVAYSDRLPLTLLIHCLSAKYALINKLIQQYESSLITHNPRPQRKIHAFSKDTGDGGKGEGTYLADPDPELSSAQPPCRRAGLGGGTWKKREL